MDGHRYREGVVHIFYPQTRERASIEFGHQKQALQLGLPHLTAGVKWLGGQGAEAVILIGQSRMLLLFRDP